VLTGGGGADRLEGMAGDDRIDGGAGGDVLAGGTGADTQLGGDGNDVFISNTVADGRDVFVGGGGTDRVDYSARTRSNGVVAQPNGKPMSGERPGGGLAFTDPIPSLATLVSDEGDLIQPDVENVRGTNFADVLGAPMVGGRLEGLAGTDVLIGGPGSDAFDGAAGFDRLLTRDGKSESIVCGTQVDRVHADISESPNADCESVARSFAVALTPMARELSPSGALPVRVACPPQAARRCVGAVRVVTLRRVRTAAGRMRERVLGAGRFNVPSGTTLEIQVVVGQAGRDVLDDLGGSTRVRLAARGRDDAGPARPAAARLVLST
jgi:Ca2+-binding RTX toxin-like protein